MTREEAIKELEQESCYECTWGCESPINCTCPRCDLKDALKMAIEALKDRPHGEWIKESLQIDERHFRSYAKCKVCGCEFKPYSFAVKEFDFCPKCGSDNRKREGESN